MPHRKLSTPLTNLIEKEIQWAEFPGEFRLATAVGTGVIIQQKS